MSTTKEPIIDCQPIKINTNKIYPTLINNSSIKTNKSTDINMCSICKGEIATNNPDEISGIYKECWFCWNY